MSATQFQLEAALYVLRAHGARRPYMPEVAQAIEAMVMEIERLQTLVPPDGALVLVPMSGEEVKDGAVFVFGDDLKLAIGSTGEQWTEKFGEQVAVDTYGEWKP